MSGKPKQIIVVRKDLNMRKGKIAAQVAHASMGVLLNLGTTVSNVDDDNVDHGDTFILKMTGALQEWLRGAFTKICVSVDSEKELLDLAAAASDAGLIHCLITDNGATEFHGVPTNTCLAIGPAYPEELAPLTGTLKLL